MLTIQDIFYNKKLLLLEDKVDNDLQDYIYDICQNDLAYTYSSSTNPPSIFKKVNQNIKNNIYDDFFLCCNLKNIFPTSNTLNYSDINLDLGHSLFVPLYLTLSTLQIKIKYQDIIRCQINYQIPSLNNVDEKKHNTPHLDFPQINEPCFTLIYYVNDSDGDTVFFNEELNTIRRITPKKGNMVLFNGNTPHSSSHPIQNHRYIISYTFLYKGI